jgi:flagellar basal body rod protein FlgG
MDPIVTAHYGMMAAMNRFDAAAQRTVRSAGGEFGDLAQASLDSSEAKAALEANAAVVRTADEMLGAVLDLSA